jgi:CHAT domain-containing protein
VASSLNDLGVLYRTKGDFVRAEQLLQRAMTMQEKALGEEHNSFAGTLNSLAGLYREKGDYAGAEPLYQRAVAIREKTNHPYLAVSLNNLANLYRDMGDYEKAEPLYLRSIAIKEKSVGPDHPDVGDSRCNIAFLYYARGDYAKAETLYLSALATLEKALGPNNLRVGLHLGHFADVYLATNDYAKAEPLYHRALSSLEKAMGTNYYELANILVNLAQISVAEGKLDEAVAYQARANAIIEYNLSLNLAAGSERQKLAYLARLPEQVDQAVSLHVRFANDDPKARELAATTLLQRKGRVQDAMSASLASLRSRFSREDQALLDQLNAVTSQLAQMVLNGPQGMSLAEHQKRIKALEDQREKLEAEIGSRSAEFRAVSRPATLAAIRSAIPVDAALIEIAVYRPLDPKANKAKDYGEARYVAYVVRRHGAVQWKELGDARAIDGAVDDLRKALRDPKRKDVNHLSRALDERVMRPVRALVGDATHLLVSPDGALSLIPFEALVDEQNRYLIERYSFNYLTSGRDLLRLQVARNSLGNPLVLADPSFGEPETTHVAISDARKQAERAQSRKRQSVITGDDLSNVYFAPLSGTEREARTIKSLFPEITLLTGAEATEAGLKQAAAPRLLHIATHGFFLTDEPPATQTRGTRAISASAKIDNPLLRSGLALAGANLHKGSGDDGILTALEATGLNLWGTKLVVLSACDTGVGEVKNGEGVYGLRRAFVLAGAESTVMSLWPVSDYVTREIMISYYKGLKQGLGRVEALRQVQLSMLNRKGRAHPFYWASFIQSGEWANLDGRR